MPDTSGALLFRRDSQFGEALVAVDLGFGTMRSKKRAIKRIARDSGLVALLVDNDNPEKIILAYDPSGKLPVELAHLEVV